MAAKQTFDNTAPSVPYAVIFQVISSHKGPNPHFLVKYYSVIYFWPTNEQFSLICNKNKLIPFSLVDFNGTITILFNSRSIMHI